MTRRGTADWLIRLGLWLQVVFLVLVDWGTIAAFVDASELPVLHLIGLIAVNIVLGGSAVIALRWTRRVQREDAGGSLGAGVPSARLHREASAGGGLEK